MVAGALSRAPATFSVGTVSFLAAVPSLAPTMESLIQGRTAWSSLRRSRRRLDGTCGRRSA